MLKIAPLCYHKIDASGSQNGIKCAFALFLETRRYSCWSISHSCISASLKQPSDSLRTNTLKRCCCWGDSLTMSHLFVVARFIGFRSIRLDESSHYKPTVHAHWFVMWQIVLVSADFLSKLSFCGLLRRTQDVEGSGLSSSPSLRSRINFAKEWQAKTIVCFRKLVNSTQA